MAKTVVVDNSSINTITAGTVIKGSITSPGDFRMDGLLEGDITINGKCVQNNPNVFDKTNPTIINAFVNGSNGLLNAPTNNQKSIAIPVKPNTSYTITGVERASSNYGLYDDTTLVVGTSTATTYANINNGYRQINFNEVF